jgi:hypothetical protein
MDTLTRIEIDYLNTGKAHSVTRLKFEEGMLAIAIVYAPNIWPKLDT